MRHRWRLGLDGAAAAFFASNFTYTLLLVCYTAWRDSRLAHSPERTWCVLVSQCSAVEGAVCVEGKAMMAV